MEEVKETKVGEKVEKKEVKEVKKLDDVKDSPENKAALAAHAGVPSDEGKAEGKANSEVGSRKSEVGKKGGKGKKVEKLKKDKKEIVELEREYIVPLRRGFLNVPRYRRAKKAVRVLKEFMVRHMNIRDGDLGKVKIDMYLNNEIWFRGIKKPMNKVKVRAKKVGGIVYVELVDVPDVVRFAKAREIKRKMAAEKVKPKKVKAEKPVEDKDKDKDGVDDKKEEAEDKKAGAEKAAKVAKVKAKEVKHTAQGKHLKKTMPVRKALKK